MFMLSPEINYAEKVKKVKSSTAKKSTLFLHRARHHFLRTGIAKRYLAYLNPNLWDDNKKRHNWMSCALSRRITIFRNHGRWLPESVNYNSLLFL